MKTLTPKEVEMVEYLLLDYLTQPQIEIRNQGKVDVPWFRRSERSTYKNISIDLLPWIRQYFKEQGKKVRIRYRGTRVHPMDRRYRGQRMQDCLKQFANRFSVYFD